MLVDEEVSIMDSYDDYKKSNFNGFILRTVIGIWSKKLEMLKSRLMTLFYQKKMSNDLLIALL